jgi:hypothetical protein
MEHERLPASIASRSRVWRPSGWPDGMAATRDSSRTVCAASAALHVSDVV